MPEKRTEEERFKAVLYALENWAVELHQQKKWWWPFCLRSTVRRRVMATKAKGFDQ